MGRTPGRPPKKRRKLNSRSTRGKAHFLFKSRKLPTDCLPTSFQLLEYYFFLRDIESFQHDIYKKMAEDLVNIWEEKAKIPTINFKSVRNKLESNLSKHVDTIRKIPMKQRNSGNENLSNILCSLEKCFNISKCQCFTKVESYEEIDPKKCSCVEEFKIPPPELEFYFNQLSKHQLPKDKILYISPKKDVKTSKLYEEQQIKLENKAKRKAEVAARVLKYKEQKVIHSQKFEEESKDDNDSVLD